LAGAGGGTSALLRGGAATIRTAEGATVTLRNLGKFTSITQGVDVGAGVASGVIIANVWLEQIQRINNSNLPPEEKRRQVGAILQQAAMMGGVIVVGHGVSRFAPLVADELNNLLRGARLEPELEQFVRNTPGLQHALQEEGSDRLQQLYKEYKAGGNTAGNGASFLEYVANRGAAAGVARAPLTQALGVSAESLSRMTPRELNESILRRTSPELLTALRRGDLPADVQASLNDALNQDYRLASSPNFAAARRTLSEILESKLGASADASPALRQALRSLAGEAVWPGAVEDQQAIREIANYRQQTGMPAYQWRPGETGTVAYVEVGGRRFYGHNTGLERKYLNTDNRALREAALAEIQNKTGQLKNFKYGDWDVRFLTHAEAEALVKAHAQFGRLPERMTLYVDRITCNNCEESLPLLVEAYGVKELRIVDAKGKQLVIRPGQPIQEIK
jgi:hypothetical protein